MSVEVNCSGCGVKLRVPHEQGTGVICPRCLTAIFGTPTPGGPTPLPPTRPGSPRAELSVPHLNTDVRREMSWTAWILTGLIVVCVFGLMLMLGKGPPKGQFSDLDRWVQFLMIGFAVLDVLVIAVLVKLVWQQGRSDSAGEAVLKVVLTIFIVGGVTVAMIVVAFFATCTSVLLRMGH